MPKSTRRRFFQTAATAAALAVPRARTLAADAASHGSPGNEEKGVYLEPAKEVPIVSGADVVVCGAGPAGVAAAIAAAREGAKTRLIEVNGCLGGIWTAGLLCYIIDSANKKGLMPEILRRLVAKEDKSPSHRMHDPEVMKRLLEEMCAEAGVDVRLHTRSAAAVCEGRQLKYVLTESKSGREAVPGKVFIDATGDGDLAAQAGCRFDFGHPETGAAQPMSFIVLLTGIRFDAVREFLAGMPKAKSWSGPKDAMNALIRKATGEGASYGKPSLFPYRDDLFCLMANHEYGFKGFDAGDLTKATLRGRDELHRIVDGLRALGGPWKDLRICASPERIGVREGRRILGRYTITDEDIAKGAKFDDAVCTCTFCVDVHSTNAKKTKGIEKAHVKAKPFDIPLRSCIAADVDNLYLAGRCISGSFYAHSAYRVTGNAVATGEAVGRAAAT